MRLDMLPTRTKYVSYGAKCVAYMARYKYESFVCSNKDIGALSSQIQM